ncbi:MAG TPA: MBL fold metallo-hydrolase [Mucilaginibacter sp.]|nr:MBL fold metallo-hydrolase [Mucilaginibacter sp.]
MNNQNLFTWVARAATSLSLSLILSFGYGQAMQAHYVNVGQAASAVLEFPCGAVLIDAGAQDHETQTHLLNYLDAFFQRRLDLHNTFDLVIITHDHIDHDTVLKAIAAKYHIKNYVDNGVRRGSGKVNQNWLEDNATAMGIRYESFSFEQITATGKSGLKTPILDPLKCNDISPVFTVFSGRFDKKPIGWTKDEFKTKGNLHSLVIRLDYGKASFLFTGDLELKAITKVHDYYNGTSALDVDVWEASHHGSNNGTTEELLKLITPKYVVISVGHWNSGIDKPSGTFNTFHYGHPRLSTIKLLSDAVPGNRSTPTHSVAFRGVGDTTNVIIKKNVYLTSTDGDVTIEATAQGSYTVKVAQ